MIHKIIPHIYRNKYLKNHNTVIISSSSSSSNVGSGGGTSVVGGNYLPATKNEDGTYKVDLTTVQFTGNIFADGEVSAYGQGGGGTTSSGNTEIIDALTSSSVTAALSANQGRILNDKIITLSGDTYTKAQVDALISGGTSSGNTNLENYYTKEETYSKAEVDEKISGHTGNYLPANKNDDGSYTVDLEKVTFNGRIVATSEISAYGEGDTPEGIVVDLSNYYTKDQVYNKTETYTKTQIEALVANSNTGTTVDLSNYYTKTQTDSKITSSLSGYATQTWVQNQNYLTGYTLPSNIVYDEDLANYFTKTEVNNKLAGYSPTGHTHTLASLSATGHTHTISQVTNLQTTLNNKFNTSGGTISGDLYVTGKIIAEGEISAYGEGESGGGTSLDLSNYYTKDQVYNTGETYNKAQVDALIATNTGVTVDLSNYYTKTQTDTKLAGKSDTSHTHSNYSVTSHTHDDRYFTETEVTNKLAGYSPTSHSHSNYSVTSHTHPISAITNLQSSLDGKSGTGHSHSNYSLTSHTHSNYSTTGHTHDDRYFTESEITTKLAGKSNTGHTHAYSELTSTAHTHAYSSITNTGHTHSISNITNLQTTLDGKSGTGHSHNITALTSGKCAYNLYVKKSAAQVVCENSAGNVISLHNDSNRGIYDNTTSKWMIGNNGTNTFLQLGLVGIGTQSPTYKLTVEGGGIKASGNIIAGGEVTALSDARLKKNITPLENVGKLNPVRYIKDGKPSIGFVAQDVRELYPELVEETNTEEKYLSVNYPQITAVLASQINELYDVIDKLKQEIKELKNK